MRSVVNKATCFASCNIFTLSGSQDMFCPDGRQSKCGRNPNKKWFDLATFPIGGKPILDRCVSIVIRISVVGQIINARG
eukprot:200151-Amphidinium_carterae.1